MILPSQTRAGFEDPPHDVTKCDRPITVIENRDDKSRAYRVQGTSVLFNPDLFFNRPPVISRLDFAMVCLSVAESGFAREPFSEQLCQAVNFLKRRALFGREDLADLERFANSRNASGTKFDGAAMKIVFSCFYG